MIRMIRIDASHQIGAQVVRLRKERGWNQGELARRSGLHQSCISDVEAGQRLPTQRTLIAILSAFGLQMAWVEIDIIK